MVAAAPDMIGCCNPTWGELDPAANVPFLNCRGSCALNESGRFNCGALDTPRAPARVAVPSLAKLQLPVTLALAGQTTHGHWAETQISTLGVGNGPQCRRGTVV